MYNNVKLNSTNNTVDEAFLNFLSACKDFSGDSSEENYVKASNFMDDVLQLNFEYSYVPSYNRLHSL